MIRIVISADGDGIGAQVGQAVLANDINMMRHVSQIIQEGQDVLTSWVEHKGGELVSAGGDEMVAVVEVDPETAIEELEHLRAAYKSVTGATLSLGVGKDLSQSGKALLFTKLHGKDSTHVYHDDMDASIAEAHQHVLEGNATEEEEKQDEHYIAPMLEGEESEIEPNEEFEEAKTPIAEVVDRVKEKSPEIGEEQEETPEQEISADEEEGATPPTLPEDGNTMAVGISGDEPDVEYEDVEGQYTPSDEVGAGSPIDGDEELPMDDSQLDEEGGTVDGSEDGSDIDLDGEEFHDDLSDGSEEDPSLEESEEEIEIPDSKLAEELQRQQDEDQEANQGGELEEAEGDGLEGNSLIEGNEEEAAAAEEMAGEEEAKEGLRQQVGAALDVFRQQRETLLAMKDQAPELYEANIGLLQALIAMSNLMFGAPQEMAPEQQMEEPADVEMPDQEMPGQPPVEAVEGEQNAPKF